MTVPRTLDVCPQCNTPVPASQPSLCPTCQYPLVLEHRDDDLEATARDGLRRPTEKVVDPPDPVAVVARPQPTPTPVPTRPCPRCQLPNPVSAVACARCSLSLQGHPTGPTGPTGPPVPAAPPPPPRRSVGQVVLIVALVLVALLMLASYLVKRFDLDLGDLLDRSVGAACTMSACR